MGTDTISITLPRRAVIWFAAGLVTALALTAVLAGVRADAAPGPDESTFVPITPCRLFDTRAGAFNVGTRDTPLAANESHPFQVTGINGSCSIPDAATAVSINLTGVGATEATNLRLHPADEPVPNAAAVNLRPGQGPTPNKLDVKLSTDGQLGVFNRFGTVDVVGDVLGYYTNEGLQSLLDEIYTRNETDLVVERATSLVVPLDGAGVDETFVFPTPQASVGARTFTTPRAAHLLISIGVQGSLRCATDNTVMWWIELDGTPIRSSVRRLGEADTTISEALAAMDFTGITDGPIDAGDHDVVVRAACETGDAMSAVQVTRSTGYVMVLDDAFGDRAS